VNDEHKETTMKTLAQKIEKAQKLSCTQKGRFAIQVHDGQGWVTVGRYATEEFARGMAVKAARHFGTECKVVG
jgi:hypothetical protein